MNKTTQLILLAAILAASVFASAQTPASPASRADGTERRVSTGELAKPNASETMEGNTSGLTRAEVKSEIGTTEPRKLGTG